MRALFEHLLLPHEGVTHALGLSAELDEPPVVDDAVYDGGHLVVAEHRSPPAELQVRGDQHRLPLVGVGEDLEEVSRRPGEHHRLEPGRRHRGALRKAARQLPGALCLARRDLREVPPRGARGLHRRGDGHRLRRGRLEARPGRRRG